MFDDSMADVHCSSGSAYFHDFTLYNHECNIHHMKMRVTVRRLRSLSLCLCDGFRTLNNSLVCYTSHAYRVLDELALCLYGYESYPRRLGLCCFVCGTSFER